MKKKILLTVSIISLLLVGCGTNNSNNDSVVGFSSESSLTNIAVTSVSFDSNSVELDVDETTTLTYKVFPENATNKNVIFVSDNNDIVEIQQNGVIKAKSKGIAHITITTEDGNKTDTCSVQVYGDNLNKTRLRYNYNDYSWYVEDNILSTPTIGDPKLLIVPVWFTDSSDFITNNEYKKNVREDIQKVYLGTNEDTGWRSVSSFYEEESSGNCVITGTVTDWYEVGKSSNDFKSTDSGRMNTHLLVNEAVDWYFANNPDDDIMDYDTNDDGALDGVILIYAAPDYFAAGGTTMNNLWAYCSHANTSAIKGSHAKPKACPYFWASYDMIYGSNVAKSRTGSAFHGGETDHCLLDSHSFTHEMGHMLGLDDYYDYGPKGYSLAGGFSMQDLVSGGHDPFSVAAYGWTRPYIPEETCTLCINDFQSSKDIILLSPNWNDDSSPFDEYLLLELFSPTGLNEMDCKYQYSDYDAQGPNEIGIRLWHVDARLTCKLINGNKYSQDLFNVPNKLNTRLAFNNTFNNGTSLLGDEYDNHALLQLIRNNSNDTYLPKSHLKAEHLFKAGETFTMSEFKRQFIKNGKLNSGEELGWSFSVDSITNKDGKIKARVTCTKE